VSGAVEVRDGQFYEGTRTDGRVELSLRASSRWNAYAAYEVDDVRLPQGDFTAAIAELTVCVNISPRLTVRLCNQWDNASETYGLNARVHFMPRPGDDVFFVLNQGLTRRPRRGRRSRPTSARRSR